MLKRLYEWTLSMATHPRALLVLFVVAFAESSFFPIPPDLLMIPMILAQPRRAFVIAGIATVASVLGGIAGYAIGYWGFDAIGQPILSALGKESYFDNFSQRYNEWGIWVVLAAGVTPFPYKVITILSGATQLPLGVFIASSIAARALRFFIVAGLLWWAGPPMREFIEKRLGLAFTLALIVLFGGFFAVRLL